MGSPRAGIGKSGAAPRAAQRDITIGLYRAPGCPPRGETRAPRHSCESVADGGDEPAVERIDQAREERHAPSGESDCRRSLVSGASDLPAGMRAAVQQGPGELRVEERPMPQPAPGEVLPVSWMLKELTIRSSLGCSRDEQQRALAWVIEESANARPLVTRRIGLDEVPAAMIDLAAVADEIKVVVEHGRR